MVKTRDFEYAADRQHFSFGVLERNAVAVFSEQEIAFPGFASPGEEVESRDVAAMTEAPVDGEAVKTLAAGLAMELLDEALRQVLFSADMKGTLERICQMPPIPFFRAFGNKPRPRSKAEPNRCLAFPIA